MDKPRIYVHCPDLQKKVGGVEWLYRHVDILNSSGFDAVIVHRKQGFSVQWMPTVTPVVYAPAPMREEDVAVFPEVWGPAITSHKAARKVIFCQNAYYTYDASPLGDTRPLPYTSPQCLGAIVMSQDSGKYLQSVYPNLPVYRIWCSVDRELYYPQPKKAADLPPAAQAPEGCRAGAAHSLRLQGIERLERGSAQSER